MKSPRRPTYVSGPWPNRRSSISLWLASLLFAATLVSRSDSAQSAIGRAANLCLQYLAALLAAIGINAGSVVQQPVPKAPTAIAQASVPKAKVKGVAPAALGLAPDNAVRKYTYAFE